MAETGIARYDQQRTRSTERGTETQAPSVRHLLRDAVVKLTEGIVDWLPGKNGRPGKRNVATRYIKQVDPAVTAFITGQTVLDQISKDRPATAVAIAIGTALEDEARLSQLKRKLPGTWADFLRVVRDKGDIQRRKALRGLAAAADDEWERWPKRDRLHVGNVLIELMVEKTGMIRVSNRKAYKGRKMITVAWVEPTPELEAWLRESDEANRLRFPMYLPLVEPPDDWVSQTEGGYPDNIYMRWPLVKADQAARSRIRPETCPAFFNAVNSLQRTAWEINPDVFAMLDYFWTEGIPKAGVPAREPQPLPGKPEDIGTNAKAKKAWCRRAAKVYTENAQLSGRRTLMARIHTVAKQFRHQPFWFPYKADFRGRLYPIPPFLNPQGSDVAKGLLRFARSQPIDTEEARAWLAVHGANCWGEDKVTLEERVAWVEAREADILRVHEDPLMYPTWTEASEPWQFLAFCLEWGAMREAEAAGKVFHSKLPVAMDGSNNGLQLYSLALRDTEGARATNVLPSDEPQDIYQEVADLVTVKLKEDAESLDEAASAMARTWLLFVDGRVPRAATKRPVMVQPYGGTMYSCREYVEDWHEEELKARGLRDDPPFAEVFKHTHYLSKHVWDSIESIVVGARSGMVWLQECAARLVELNVPVVWRSPCGFYVTQFKESQTSSLVRTKMGHRLIVRRLRVGKGSVSPRAMVNGIAPNFVHALDASILVNTINRCVEQGITEFAMVHDSYATHAANAPALAGILRGVTVDIFRKDVLQDFKDQVEDRYKVAMPDLPVYGDLDPEVLLQSKYFFA